MEYAALFQAIRHISPGITEEELQQLLPLLTRKSYKRGDYLVMPGQNARYFNYIEQGSGRMFYLDQEGKESNIVLSVENGFLQDYESLLFNRPSAFYIQALEDTEVIRIAYDGMETLFGSSINWAHFGRMINQFVLIGVFRRVQMLMFLSPEEIYLRLIQEEPQLLERFSLEHIAAYIGIQRESLSRIRNRLGKSRNN